MHLRNRGRGPAISWRNFDDCRQPTGNLCSDLPDVLARLTPMSIANKPIHPRTDEKPNHVTPPKNRFRFSEKSRNIHHRHHDDSVAAVPHSTPPITFRRRIATAAGAR